MHGNNTLVVFAIKPSMRSLAALIIVISISITSFIIFRSPGLDPFPGRNVAFEEIDKGFYCGIDTRLNLTVTTLEEWDYLWNNIRNKTTSEPDLPVVDFTNEIVIAIFQGTRATGGYETVVRRITETGATYDVFIDEIHPGPSAVVTMAITQPYHIVRAPVTVLGLSFQFHYNIFNRTV